MFIFYIHDKFTSIPGTTTKRTTPLNGLVEFLTYQEKFREIYNQYFLNTILWAFQMCVLLKFLLLGKML